PCSTRWAITWTTSTSSCATRSTRRASSAASRAFSTSSCRRRGGGLPRRRPRGSATLRPPPASQGWRSGWPVASPGAKSMKRLVLLAVAVALVVGSGRASAQTVFKSLDADAWCRERETDPDRESHCEVREATWRGRGESPSIAASPNGGIEVTGWDRPEVKVRAKVVAVADSVDEAARLAAEVRIESAGTIHA